MAIITTSWDDGHKLDLKLAELLNKYNLKGTFYITKENSYFKNNRLSNSEIMRLSNIYEIGAHTITHPNLLSIPLEKAKEEIVESKGWLESVVTKKVEMFCYPKGYYNERIIDLVKQAGFKGARTTEKFVVEKPVDKFKIGTTIQVYPFPIRKKNRKHYFWRYLLQPLFQNYSGIRKLKISFFSLRNWYSFAKAVFDASLEKGEYFHLWGHSWEIEQYGMWKELENFLKYISRRENCISLTNGEFLRYENFNSSR